MTVRKAGVLLLVLLTLIAFSSCKQILDEAAREAAEKDKEHYVSFNPGMGHWIDNGTSETRIQYVRHGGYAMDPGPVELFGHEFVGWKINNSYYDFSDPVTGNLVCTAEWKPKTMSVSVVDNGASRLSLKVQYDPENQGMKIIDYVSSGTFHDELDLRSINEQLNGNGEGFDTVSIGSRAFKYDFNTKFTTIRLPDTVKEIADRAFSECYATDIYIPSSVKKMGDHVFSLPDGMQNSLNMTVHLTFGSKEEVPEEWAQNWDSWDSNKAITYKYGNDGVVSNP